MEHRDANWEVVMVLLLAVMLSVNFVVFNQINAQQERLAQAVAFIEWEQSRVVALRRLSRCETDKDCQDAWEAAYGVAD